MPVPTPPHVGLPPAAPTLTDDEVVELFLDQLSFQDDVPCDSIPAYHSGGAAPVAEWVGTAAECGCQLLKCKSCRQVFSTAGVSCEDHDVDGLTITWRPL